MINGGRHIIIEDRDWFIFTKGDYINASKNYLESFKLNESIENNKKETIKISLFLWLCRRIIGESQSSKRKNVGMF